MPEIAEVALMVDAIREILKGQRLAKIEVLGGRYQKHPLDNLTELAQQLPLKVSSINVKGKFCWIELGNNWYLSITFGMAGGIYYEPNDAVLQDYTAISGKVMTRQEYMKHFHVKFEAEDGHCFYFGDPRHFGTISIATNRTSLDKKLGQLGPDMLTGSPISDAQFIQIFRRAVFNNKNICRVLMEQKAVSGVGNYIKAEILYQCRINPWAIVTDLSDSTLIQLHQAIRSIAQMAYRGHGATLYTYSGTRREKGSFQEMLKVYGKDVDPYGNPIVLISDQVSPDKRTTHYVPSVQTIGSHRDPCQGDKGQGDKGQGQSDSVSLDSGQVVPKIKFVIKLKHQTH